MFGPGGFLFSLLLALFGITDVRLVGATELDVHLHDDAGLAVATLDGCLSQLRAILVRAGAVIDIHVCRAESPYSCQLPKDGARVVDLRILSAPRTYSRDVQHPALGHSVVSERGGVYATVFLEAVQHQASAANVPWTVLLAYAAAHEIGHLLLGANAHTARGVMKGSWDAQDMQAIFQNSFRFSREQQKKIAECCGGGRESGRVQNFKTPGSARGRPGATAD